MKIPEHFYESPFPRECFDEMRLLKMGSGQALIRVR